MLRIVMFYVGPVHSPPFDSSVTDKCGFPRRVLLPQESRRYRIRMLYLLI
jgi:hypothetical protein